MLSAIRALLVAAAAVLALGTYGCDVDQTEEGELPEVDVEPGEAPEYDVETADIEVREEEQQVEVPDVDIGTETETVETPEVDVEMPADDDEP